MKLEIININKSFGDAHILKDINFTVESGRTMGFLGPNGSGKTTTIRALMGVFNQDSGQFLLDGEVFDPQKTPPGYLPEERGLYDQEPILSQLVYFGKLRGMKDKDARESAEYWIERFGLADRKDDKLDTLSKGNQQKIQIAQCFLTDPKILILDEPFSGLDPINSKLLRDVITEFITDEKVVIFSSHQMTYVEEFCKDVTIIKDGQVILNGDLQEIKRQRREGKLRLRISNLSDEEVVSKLKESHPSLEFSSDKTSLIVQLPENLPSNVFLQGLLDQSFEIDLFQSYEPSLNDIFIEEVGESRE